MAVVREKTTASNNMMEVCVDNIFSVVNAEIGGAVRLELCSALSEGGLTPTPGFLSSSKSRVKIPIFCMLRTRNGNFVYTEDEMDIMIADLEILKKSGADGFVFGALDQEGNVDVEKCRRIIQAATPLPVTFHRAFDEVADPKGSLRTIAGLGFSRILTSGQAKSAPEGVELLRELVTTPDILIMPGAGLNSANLKSLLEKVKPKEFHGSASKMTQINGCLLKITDPEEVKKMVQISKSL